MTTLSNAPLLEVATQFRWARLETGGDGEITFVFPEDEQAASREVLETALRLDGFTRVDYFAPELEDVPFAYSRQYRQEDREWPVIQTGLGVAGVNTGNEGYDWEPYKDVVLRAFSIFRAALGSRYPEGIPFFGCELLYLDGFPLAPGETPEQFLKSKLNATLRPPKPFLQAPFLQDRPNVASVGLSFEIHLAEPPGLLIVDVDYEPELLGRPGFAMDTRVRSVGRSVEYTNEGVDTWLELAHRVQRHAFKTLITENYRESFQ